jgi:orotate phosphoribosyltransferase
VQEVATALADGVQVSRELPDGSVEARLRAMLLDSEALLEGHFLLSSGLHSDRYVQCAKLLQHPRYARRAGTWLAAKVRRYEPTAVVSVALGGLVIGQEVAAALGVRAVFTERDDAGTMQLRRGFELAPGERVVVIDDVCTKGGSIAEATKVVRALGARPEAAASIIDRSGGTHTLDLPLEALLEVQARTWSAAECPQCAAGRPVVKPGSRKLATV